MKVQLHPVETRVVCPVCVRDLPNPDHTGTVWTSYDLTRVRGEFYCEVCRTRFTEFEVWIGSDPSSK